MLLVLFAVVLLLPAFQVEGERHRRSPDPCYRDFLGGSEIWCKLNGYGGFKSYDSSGCNVTCNAGPLTLPETVCIVGSPPCKKDNDDAVGKWKEDLEKKKADLLREWCYCPKCY
ncbi:uncharacterized protein LOC115329562 [Ixodes scapularis]|uniref:uncharacterized protein LOC115329562 n=1 Tax=Ixodes scapularis TaxID=6945 RepID=UPI001A9E5EAE|nr:uncharacterized protein LOC115329562 [Ixodes scapularis]